MKKALRGAQTLHAGCSKVEPKIGYLWWAWRNWPLFRGWEREDFWYFVQLSSISGWGTSIRGLVRGMATLPKVTRSY